jgi:Caspase domain
MNKLTSSWFAALSGILLALLSASAAWAERRVALIIGNSQYKDSSLVLFNPKNDAEDVAASLRTLGFEVILKIDAGKRDFDLAMAQFARLATSADTALFYYAGHALQHQGQNYLMPTDAQLLDEISLRYQMVSLDDVRVGLARAGGVKIMILDACRNNPIVDRLRGKTDVTRNLEIVRGLARIGIEGTEGEVVAYATATNQVAGDGSGRNSPFTAALLNRLGEPGLEIGTMFRRIAADVYERTKGQQRPELLISLISEYYLNQFPASLEREQQVRPLPVPTIPSPPIAQEEACKRDGERLARLRAIPATRPELIRFERELGCEGLRPQVDRLRESISAEGERDDEAAQRFQVEQRRPTADAELQKPKSDPLAQVAPPQDSRVEDQPGRQDRPRRRAAGSQGSRGDLTHSRRPDPPGPPFSFQFQPFTLFDANRHDAIHRCDAPPLARQAAWIPSGACARHNRQRF